MAASPTNPQSELIIIESPKKITTLNSILKGLGKEMRIEATLGRLYDISPVDPDQFLREGRIQWQAIRPAVVERISSAIVNYDRIYVATDSDVEGEVIAWHIQRLAESSGKAVERIHIKSLTEQGISNAINSKCDIDFRKAEGGVARRIFDNFSQFAVDEYTAKTKPYLRGSVGRIVTPLLSSIAKRPLVGTSIRRSVPYSDVDIVAHIPNGISEERVLRDIERLPPPVVSNLSTTTMPLSGGLSLPDALSLLPGPLGAKPSDVHKDLEELYEEGRVTYFRTDSRRMSPSSALSMSKKLTREGIHGRGIPGNSEAGRQDAHEAIMPLEMLSNPFSPISRLSRKDALMSLLWRHYAMIHTGHEIKTTIGKLSGSAAENQGWLRLVREGVVVSAERSVAISELRGVSRPWDKTFLPLGIPCSESIGEMLYVRRYDAEQLVVDRLIEEGLGRPSTLGQHGRKISNKFLPKGYLNGRSYAAIREAEMTAPNLLLPEIARELEEQIHKGRPGDTITDRVHRSLTASRWVSEQQVNMDHDVGQRPTHRNFSQSFSL